MQTGTITRSIIQRDGNERFKAVTVQQAGGIATELQVADPLDSHTLHVGAQLQWDDGAVYWKYNTHTVAIPRRNCAQITKRTLVHRRNGNGR